MINMFFIFTIIICCLAGVIIGQNWKHDWRGVVVGCIIVLLAITENILTQIQ